MAKRARFGSPKVKTRPATARWSPKKTATVTDA